MASYLNNLQNEVYHPPPRTTSRSRTSRSTSRSSQRRQRSLPCEEDEAYYTANDNDNDDNFNDEPDSRDARQKPLTATTKKKRKMKQQVTTTKTVKTTVLHQQGGKIISQETTTTPAVISTVVRDATSDATHHTSSRKTDEDSSLRSSALSFGSFNNNHASSSSRARPRTIGSNTSLTTTTKQQQPQPPDIYEAYKRLRQLSRDGRSSVEHGSNTQSQETPVTSSSTQLSTEDEHSHMKIISSSSARPQKQKKQQQQQQQQQQQNSHQKVPTDMRIETTRENLTKPKPQQNTNNNITDTDHSQKTANSKKKVKKKTTQKVSAKNGTEGSAASSSSNKVPHHVPVEKRKLKQSQQPKVESQHSEEDEDDYVLPMDNVVPVQQQQQQQLQPIDPRQFFVQSQSTANIHAPVTTTSSNKPGVVMGGQLQFHPKPEPTQTQNNNNSSQAPSLTLKESSDSRSTSTSAEDEPPMKSLHHSLESGVGVSVSYSKRMSRVKESIRDSIHLPNEFHSSSSSSSTSLSSSKGRAKGFLSGIRGHPKPNQKQRHLSEEERRRAHNPFLNRPTAIKIDQSYGYKPDNTSKFDDSRDKHPNLSTDNASSGDKDFRRRQAGDDEEDSDDKANDNSDIEMYYDETGYYSSIDHAKERSRIGELQRKYCPLPKPMLKVQRFCGKIVCNQSFQIFMVVLIMFNAIILGIATYDFTNPKIPQALEYIDKTLLVFFTFELALQFGYCGITLFLDGWLVFDTLTVVTSWFLEGVQVFRSFRIFRSFRLIVRLPILKNLVLTVFHVMPRIYSILCLLLLILYIYAVMCTVLFGDMYALGLTDEQYFGRLDYSLFTLFQMVTLENWTGVVRQVAPYYPWYASLIFSTFIIVTGFIMYNLIVAVMCDSMLVVEAQGREEKKAAKRERKRIEELAKIEEDKKLHYEMLRQRSEQNIARQRVKGLVNDDPTVEGKGSVRSDLGTDDFNEEDNESIIECVDHVCENCGYCEQIPKLPEFVRRQNRERAFIMEENQERVRSLKRKVEQLAQAQQRVTAVLQTLMLEVEASREHASHKSASHNSTSHNNASHSSILQSSNSETTASSLHKSGHASMASFEAG